MVDFYGFHVGKYLPDQSHGSFGLCDSVTLSPIIMVQSKMAVFGSLLLEGPIFSLP